MNKTKKSRLLSFLLAMIMIFGTISPAFAAGLEAPNETLQKTESELVSENGKLRAKLVVPEKTQVKQRSARIQTRSINLATFQANNPEDFNKTTVEVNIVKHGIGSNDFDFNALFGAGASKKITLENWADDTTQEVTFTADTTSVTFSEKISMTDVVNGEVFIAFEGGNVAGKLTYEESDPDYSGASNITTFTLDLYQVRNTDVVVKTEDAEGNEVATDPTTADTNGKIKLGDMEAKDIPGKGETLSFVDRIRVSNVDKLNAEPNYTIEGLNDKNALVN